MSSLKVDRALTVASSDVGIIVLPLVGFFIGTLEESCDALSYCLLVNISELQSYISMLLEVHIHVHIYVYVKNDCMIINIYSTTVKYYYYYYLSFSCLV